MPRQPSVTEEGQRFFEFFRSRGAVPFNTAILQTAESLLDLYGEDIRGRAFVTVDSAHGELMLRPDFTVPLAKHHMESGSGSAAYAYLGAVFRRQQPGSDRPSEYLQAGYEQFGGDDVAAADAEVFCAFHQLLSPLGLRTATGDLGLLIAAVDGLAATDSQKASLKRHIWRPRRFRRLLESYSGGPGGGGGSDLSDPAVRKRCLAAGPAIGQRSLDEVVENVRAKTLEAKAPPLNSDQVTAIDAILAVKGTMRRSLGRLRAIARQLPRLSAAVDRLEARMEALSGRGIAAERLWFEASYGRTSLEYYDGFVFGFFLEGDEQPAALGGRYDFLTAALGGGRRCPAVGGMVRPALTAQMRGTAE